MARGRYTDTLTHSLTHSPRAPSIYFHAYPHVMTHDPYSGDYGLGFFGSSLQSSATFVLDDALGPLCYLCDTSPLNASSVDLIMSQDGSLPLKASSADLSVSLNTSSAHLIVPRDAYRQRVYLEPIGTYVQTDTGVIQSMILNLQNCSIHINFAPANKTPGGYLTYDNIRLRVDKLSRESANRPGGNFTVETPRGVAKDRDAFEIPASASGVTAVIRFEDKSCSS